MIKNALPRVIFMLMAFCSSNSFAERIEVVESGWVGNQNPGQEFFNGVNVAGLPYTRTFIIETEIPGITYQNTGAIRVLTGGSTTASAIGTARQPSDAFVSYTMTVAGMQFSSEGSYLSAVQLQHTSTQSTAFIIQTRDLGKPLAGETFDLAQLYFPVSYLLPAEPSIISSGVFTTEGTDNGSSAGSFGRYVSSNSLQTLGRFDLVPNQLIVTITPVPEPSSLELALIGGLTLVLSLTRRPQQKRKSSGRTSPMIELTKYNQAKS